MSRFWSSSILTLVAITAIAALLWAENLGGTQLYSLTLLMPGVDKFLHFAQSFAVCAVMAWLLGRTGVSRGARVIVAAGVALAAAGADEFQQLWHVDRHVELADLGAGLSGIIVAVASLVTDRRARVALALVGLVMAGSFVAESYVRTRDYNRGVLADRDGRPADAVRHYLDAIRSDPENPEAYNAAAWSIAESGIGDAQQAVTLAERSLSLRPAHADTLDTYGWALFRAGRAADALVPLQAALAAKPEIYCIHYHLGAVYLELDRREEGFRHLRLQAELMPNTREARLAEKLLSGSTQSVWSHP
jgi:tetratricopeptide (TPR) repeat protein